jgi:rod shape-determining protein MreC
VKLRPGSSLRYLAFPLKIVFQRFALLFLVLAAFGMMLLSKAETVMVERVSTAVVDLVAPIMDVLSRPAASVNEGVRRVREMTAIYAENERLRRENARLLQWQEAARRLAAQNRALTALLDFKPDPRASYIAARVIGDSGGSFVRSMLVNAGSRDGIARGQAVVTGDGLVGRVAAAGFRSARVLLVTDINSRVPVILESTGQRGILAGDNSNQPRLVFLPANATVKVGDRLVTSGHGGVFPPGLPAGRVVAEGDNGIRVQPYVALDALEFVRVVDYAGVSSETLDEEIAPARPLRPVRAKRRAP